MNKVCPPKDKEFWNNEYLLKDKSITQISKEFNFNEATAWRRVKNLGLIKNQSELKKGERNPQWKGDNVGYISLHEWIKNKKVKPSLCENCQKVEPYDLANISGKYKRDINDFKWLCRSCHMKEDGRTIRLHQVNLREKDGLFRCPKCHIYKPKEDFYNSKTRRFGVYHCCKICSREYSRERYKNGKDMS